MEFCPICRATKHELSIICRCGYDFDKEEIIDKEKIREYFSKIKNTETEHWGEEVKLTRRIHEVQQKKYGRTQRGVYAGKSWKESATGNLLRISKTTVNDNIRLAKGIDECPEILKNEKKTNAIKKLSNLNKGIFGKILRKQFKTEKELQSSLETNWKKISLFDEWILKDSQKKIGEAGVIDILAHHNSEPKRLVIEIKKGESSDKTVGQILRYMGWVIEKLASENEQVLGLIISGYPPDENIRLALLNTQKVDYQIYIKLNSKNDQIMILKPEDAFDFVKFEKRPLEEQIELIKK